MPSTLRFFREFLSPGSADVAVEDTTYRRGDGVLPARLYTPRSARAPMPAWLTLHGLTYHGKEHASLVRLARALAAAGNAVLVPDIPEWRALRIAAGHTVETIKAAVLELDTRGVTAPGRVGVIGFSFGATQALIAASDPALKGHLAGVAAWGGYADIRIAVRSAFLGEHDLDGRSFTLDPDPYGRWILAGNYLGLLDEFSGGNPLPDAFLALAREAGRQGVPAWEPELDPVKANTRERLAVEDRPLFDLVAPPAGVRHTPDQKVRLRRIVDRLVTAAVSEDPLLDPRPFLPRVPVPVFLAHGRHDRLIPWTELVRLQRALPEGSVVAGRTTTLFGHSTGERSLATPATAVEGARFIAMMRAMLRLI
jgi:pimeloyl-ACP methyl ester carboxylesterase